MAEICRIPTIPTDNEMLFRFFDRYHPSKALPVSAFDAIRELQRQATETQSSGVVLTHDGQSAIVSLQRLTACYDNNNWNMVVPRGV